MTLRPGLCERTHRFGLSPVRHPEVTQHRLYS
nr:MAG TPA: hypothetical protein [Caudoviricetes sp.]DAQ65220.1 MAG TPA: hypothetical protein [Caudoviricetes sp.]